MEDNFTPILFVTVFILVIHYMVYDTFVFTLDSFLTILLGFSFIVVLIVIMELIGYSFYDSFSEEDKDEDEKESCEETISGGVDREVERDYKTYEEFRSSLEEDNIRTLKLLNGKQFSYHEVNDKDVDEDVDEDEEKDVDEDVEDFDTPINELYVTDKYLK